MTCGSHTYNVELQPDNNMISASDSQIPTKLSDLRKSIKFDTGLTTVVK